MRLAPERGGPLTAETGQRAASASATERVAVHQRTVVVAPNAFKGALSAGAAALAMRTGSLAAGCTHVVTVPMADGGDGTAEVLATAMGGAFHPCTVRDPWGRPRRTRFARLADGSAVIDLAAASGLGSRRPASASALSASTSGTGELVAAAVASGASLVRIALGGSATSDGGQGLLTALGAVVRDGEGHQLAPGAGSLATAASVDLSGLQWLRAVRFEALVDVRSPLLGPTGAARLFAPQKGAGSEDVWRIEQGLACWADVLERTTGRAGRDIPGSGAAGGTGFALAVALGARVLPGAEHVAAAVGLERQIGRGHLVLTGEGALDGQTAQGKAPAIVAALAARRGAHCCALVGNLGPGWETLVPGAGFTAVFPLAPGPRPRARALAATAADLERTATMVVRLWTTVDPCRAQR